MNRYAMGASLALAVCLTAGAADTLKSGAQKPTMPIKAFNPLHCTGPGAGNKSCLV